MKDLEKIPSADYKILAKKLQSAEELNSTDKNNILHFGLEAAHKLCLVSKVKTENKFVEEYLHGAVLWRAISLYNSAVKAGLNYAESINIFTEIKKSVCERVGVGVNEVSDNFLSDILVQEVDEFLGDEPPKEMQTQMNFIRKVAEQLVPANPIKNTREVDSSVKITLD